MDRRIVVWDPRGDFWEGSLVEESNARVLDERGVVTLPVVAEFLARAGVAGYARRAWGAGWPLDFASPRLVCPLTLFASEQHRALHWAIRLVPDSVHAGAAKEGRPFTGGVLRLVADSAQSHARMTSISADACPVDGARLGTSDADGGWTIRGKGRINPSSDGFYGFGLYGTMPGVKVAWAAISTTG